MPSKKRKYNARFPAGRIKRIMQADEEVGKIAQAVPVLISHALELFVESLLKRSAAITNSRNAKTLSTSHLKQCILSESRFDFLKDLVKTVPDIGQEDQQQDAMPSTSTNGDSNGQHHRLAFQRSQSHQPATHSSAPSTSTSNSCQYLQLNQQKFFLNNYTNQQKPNSQGRMSRNLSHPATATITSEQQQQQQSQQQSQKPIPLNFPIQISYNIDDDLSINQLESPAVKIDYSNFTLPATSPSIKIDLSNFNQQTKPSTTTPTTSTAPPTATADLDEDYDV